MADRCVRRLFDGVEPGFTRVIESATQLAESRLHTFQNDYLEFTLNEYFFSQLVDFLVIADQYSYKK